MAEFAYNNAKNAITGTSHFQLNCMFNPWVSFEENVDVRSKSKSAETLQQELKDLLADCKRTLWLKALASQFSVTLGASKGLRMAHSGQPTATYLQ